jgi:mono/diheme cytochrome c family protein
MRYVGKTLIVTWIGILAWAWLAPAKTTDQAASANPQTSIDAKSLFANHCAACHGDLGDGNGIAARFLYPKPRDFTSAEFRITSTANQVPTEDDLVRIIARGMPGSAMVPFAHLSEAERKALARYVMELTREGLIRKTIADAKVRGDAIDEPETRTAAIELLTPGAKVEWPAQWPAADAASVARGQTLYKASCATCHGETGKGDGAQDQLDTTGVPIRPRDFGRGIFKGGGENEQLYARIVVGMKGTPMTANTLLKPEEVCDLVNFINSLTPKGGQDKITHVRKAIVARRVTSLDADPARLWGSLTSIVVSPLWWTDRPDADLQVAAAHDGQSIAVRLTWIDGSQNDAIRSTEDFEDMASLQLFDRQPEPFLGMGAPGAVPDLWLWRATWSKPRDLSDSKLDHYPFADRPPGHPDQLTGRAAGNPHSRPDEAQSASQLSAKGPGTVTFRPKASQLVTATATYTNGRWNVEFRRPLKAKPDEGISLAPGQHASIAFAIWDGALRDRNGQKQISIWHDLKIE